jgi:pimeloyl-ACP methyl ester carboxylesterase
MATATRDRAAVLAPGGGYSADGPLLMYAALAVTRRGGHAHAITWPSSRPQPDNNSWVVAQVSAAIDEVTAATGITTPVVIGKSLGSMAAPLAADRGLAAVWFTPLLTDEPTVAALRRGTAPALLIGGTDDEYWDGGIARSITPYVAEIERADHRMFVPGELATSAAVLGQVMTAVERFLDQVVWP